MTIKSISEEQEIRRPARAQSASGEAAQRLAGLLREEALQDALKGLGPEEIRVSSRLVAKSGASALA